MSAMKLTSEEHDVLRECLQAAADGPFFPEWEFETLLGATREEVRALVAAWPLHRDERRAHDIARNALNNLLGYPHGQEKTLESLVSVPTAELNRVLQKLAVRDTGCEH